MAHAHITLGGGCFWCLEAVYQEVRGVVEVVSGYAGGRTEHPTYDAVCSGGTGHAEVVRVTYDTDVITLEDILEIFWKIHDPTTLNRQGADVGTQYRSIILYEGYPELEVAQTSKAKAQSRFKETIVTEIVPLSRFWPAEAYHQNYFRTHPDQGYCQAVIAPKLQKFKEAFPAN